MKKIIILSSALVLLTSYSANAQISVAIGEPVPVYVAPVAVEIPFWPSQHYDIHRHRHDDYWAGKSQEDHDRAVHADHR